MRVLHLHFKFLFNIINVTNFAIPLFTCYNMDMTGYIEHGIIIYIHIFDLFD